MIELLHRVHLLELRFAARRLRRAPGFAIAAAVVLALGIGATTAVFSLVDGILLEPLPYPQSSRLVRLTNRVSSSAAVNVDQSDASILLYQRDARAFDGAAAWRFDDGDLGPSEPGQSTVRVRGARVTANFFDVLRVRPALGRGFFAGEDRPGRNGVVVLSHHIWEERFHGDRFAIGKQIVVNDVPRTIVGIMPPRFAYPADQVELWLPLSLDPANTHPATFNLVGVARLKPGVSIDAARADLSRALPGIADFFHDDVSAASWSQSHVLPQVQSLRDSIIGPASRLLWLLFGSVLLVLLVACINVAGLFLARAERAQLELAVRGALGSGFAGMVALSLSESVLLSVIGGGAGVLLAAAMIHVAVSAGAVLSLPRLRDVSIGTPVLMFSLATVAFCALCVSVLPLLRARRVSIAQVLHGAGTGPVVGRSPQRARNMLVVAQIALAVVMVASSGLMTRSFVRLIDVRPGFDVNHVVTSSVLLPYARYGTTPTRLSFFQSLLARARAIPDVRDAALTDWVPLSGAHRDMALDVEDDAGRSGTGGSDHAVAYVGGNYFHTLGIPIIRGRVFDPPDVARPSEDVIVSRAFAERYWKGESPIGKRIRPVDGRWYTIIGEVDDVRYDGLDAPPNDIVYFPLVTAANDGASPNFPGALSIVARTDGSTRDAIAAVRTIVHSLDPAVPAYDEAALTDLVSDASARARALVVLLVMASILTSLLGAVGLYGVMAYAVSIRRRELGVRLALGATPADVSRMVSLDGLRVAGVGIAVGMACTVATTQLLRGQLFGVSPTDLATLTLTPVVLLGVAATASWIPARRAAGVDPAEALRAQ